MVETLMSQPLLACRRFSVVLLMTHLSITKRSNVYDDVIYKGLFPASIPRCMKGGQFYTLLDVVKRKPSLTLSLF